MQLKGSEHVRAWRWRRCRLHGLELLILAVGALGAAAGAEVFARIRRLPRSLAAAERAAVTASVDDPSFDPAAVLEAAARHFQPIAGHGENEPRLRAIEDHWWRLAATGTRELPWRLVEAGTGPLPARATARLRHRPRAKTHVSQR